MPVILVPRRAGDVDRDRIWKFVRRHWSDLGWPIVEGHHDDGPFNRSAALNLAAREAGDWDVAVVIDADVIVSPALVHRAVDRALESGFLVYPYEQWKALNKKVTYAISRGITVPNWDRFVKNVVEGDRARSGCFAVRRDLWDEVGGFDERFVGWGWEDVAFYISCLTLRGMERIPGECWHLWHPRQRERDLADASPLFCANRDLGWRFKQARGDQEAVRSLIEEARVRP